MVYATVVHTPGDRFVVMGPAGEANEYEVTADGYPVHLRGGAPVDAVGLRADLADELRELRREAVAQRKDRRYIAGIARALDLVLGHR